MQNLSELLKENSKIEDVKDAHELVILNDSNGANVKFENVLFRQKVEEKNKFNEDTKDQVTNIIVEDDLKYTMNGVSFEIKEGESLALVGHTGSGKSTSVKLLFRFYDLDGGRILINDQDISKITQKSLRKNLGIVPQDTVLFNDTLIYNLT